MEGERVAARSVLAIIYRVDASDRLIFVNSEFLTFARENRAPELSITPLPTMGPKVNGTAWGM